MHAARISTSGRLQAVQRLLRDGKEHSTFEIVKRASVCAVNSIIAELRANGADIECRQEHRETGRVWLYRMITPAKEDRRGRC